MAKKVLLIEDSRTDAEAAKEQLEKEGLEVNVAGSGQAGLKKAIDIKPDLVVLDLILPDADGYEICRRIKKEKALKNTIVVILSIKDTVSDITRAFEAGADDYVVKPPVNHFLAKKVMLYLGLKAGERRK